MFFLLALLEGCGYMARVAVVMDRYLKIGAFRRSIIPDPRDRMRDPRRHGDKDDP